MMNDVAVRTKKANDERERQRIIAERKKARRESIKVENMAQENSDAANGEPVDLHKIISGLAKINAELENVQVPTEPVRPEQEYMPSIQVYSFVDQSQTCLLIERSQIDDALESSKCNQNI